MTTKRRALVLTEESAGHPFLRSLPPHVRKVDDERPVRNKWLRSSESDWRTFLTAYCVCFVAVAAFIS